GRLKYFCGHAFILPIKGCVCPVTAENFQPDRHGFTEYLPPVSLQKPIFPLSEQRKSFRSFAAAVSIPQLKQ
ncbi:MAG: hypothetical protein Q8O90_04405, partial [Elusimicrobiota bacterium]|nr:hypothetical protein [Elusimicrobiota bacterium]